jgi:hypothetical protein
MTGTRSGYVSLELHSRLPFNFLGHELNTQTITGHPRNSANGIIYRHYTMRGAMLHITCTTRTTRVRLLHGECSTLIRKCFRPVARVRTTFNARKSFLDN